MYERWPNLTEAEVNTKIDAIYEKAVQVRPFYDAAGNRAIWAAASNPRQIIPAQKRYQQKIMKVGLRMGDRSSPSGFPGVGDQAEHTMLMAGKQLAEACYRCFRDAPNYGPVQHIKASGYPVMMYSSRLPLDVQKQIVRSSNQCHDGQATTLSEILDKCGDVQTHWLAKKVDGTKMGEGGQK